MAGFDDEICVEVIGNSKAELDELTRIIRSYDLAVYFSDESLPDSDGAKKKTVYQKS